MCNPIDLNLAWDYLCETGRTPLVQRYWFINLLASVAYHLSYDAKHLNLDKVLLSAESYYVILQ
jgi:hypothetical protein